MIDIDDGAFLLLSALVDEIAPDAFTGVKPHRRRLITARVVRQARWLGMADLREMAVFCALWRFPGRQFFARPAWIEAARRVREGLTTWTRVYAEPDIWEDPPA